MNNNNVSLTDKLQGLSATLRRERDDAFRQQSLAAERLAAIQQEEQALGKTVAQQQTKLAHLRAGGNVATDITTCRVQVQALKQQVNFQHADLLQKRTSRSQLKRKLKAQEASDETALAAQQAAVEQRRVALAVVREQFAVEAPVLMMGNNDKDSEDAGVALLQSELQDSLHFNHGNGSNKWPRLLMGVATKMQNHVAMQQAETAVLERVVQGYCQEFGFDENVVVQDDIVMQETTEHANMVDKEATATETAPEEDMEEEGTVPAVANMTFAAAADNSTRRLGEVTNMQQHAGAAPLGVETAKADPPTPVHMIAAVQAAEPMVE